MAPDLEDHHRAHRWPRVTLIAALLSGVWAGAVWLGGGIEAHVLGLSLRSRDPLRPALLGGVLLLAHAVWRRRQVAGDVRWLAGLVETHAGLVAALLAGAVGLTAWSSTSLVAGGADAYGYVSQAYLWLDGRLRIPQPLAQAVPWPFADLTLTPLGYRPAIGGGALVPTYAPGLPMLMAVAARLAGACGPFTIVPLTGALAVWLTYRLGRLWSPWHGLAAAAMLATSPAFAHMLMWPMSDVPVAACWLAAIVCALRTPRPRWLGAGLCISLALLVRPNLAPLVLPFAVWALRTGTWREAMRRLLWLASGILPGTVAVAAVHTALYGAPWRSGYGNLEALYAWHHLATNLARYPRWLMETETPLVAAALVPLFLVCFRRSDDDARVLFLASFVVLLWGSYLFYIPFDHWWYLRFLLPSFPLLFVLALAGWSRLASRLRPLPRAAALALVAVLVIGVGAARIAAEELLTIGEGELTYVRVADFVAERLPANAILISMQHSGSLRYYAGRPTLRYDWLPAEWWSRALTELEQRGLRPFVVVVQWEEPVIRGRFQATAPDGQDPLGCLVAQEERPEGTRIYDPRRTLCGPLRMAPTVERPCRRPSSTSGSRMGPIAASNEAGLSACRPTT